MNENNDGNPPSFPPLTKGESRLFFCGRGIFAGSIILAAIIVIIMAAAGLYLAATHVDPFIKVRDSFVSSDAALLDRNGEVIHRIRVDRKERRLDWIALDNISPALKKTVLLAEDKRFMLHHGVDFKAAASAIYCRITGGKKRGASTITMQLASLLDGSLRPGKKGRSIIRKCRQAVAALAIERKWTKDEILEAYLNLVTFRGELKGVDAASQGLFSKDPSGINVSEAAVLAAMIPSAGLNAGKIQRRAVYLSGIMNPAVPPESVSNLAAFAALKPYMIERNDNIAPHAARMLIKKDMKSPLKCTLDKELQLFVLDCMNSRLEELKSRNVNDMAVIVLDNATGDVLAYAGNSPNSPNPYVDGVKAVRQAGSTLKPFLYELAIERNYLTASSIISDAPLEITTFSGLYEPDNYAGDFAGPVTLRKALASSINTPAVRTLMMTGVEPFVERLKDAGFTTINDDADYYGYSLALGSVDVRLCELANAYRTLANGGIYSDINFNFNAGMRPSSSAGLEISKWPRRSTALRKQSHYPVGRKVSKRVMDEKSVYIIRDILSDRDARSWTFGTENFLSTPFFTAVKTGTSKDMRDNWCVGFSDKYTVAVWAGNFNGSPMWNVSGISGAAPVWFDIMNRLHKGVRRTEAEAPEGLKGMDVSFEGVFEEPRHELYIEGTEPYGRVSSEKEFSCVKIEYPVEGSVMAIDYDVPDENQRVLFRAGGNTENLSWTLNGKRIGKGKCILWKLVKGKFTLIVTDSNAAETDKVSFTVR